MNLSNMSDCTDVHFFSGHIYNTEANFLFLQSTEIQQNSFFIQFVMNARFYAAPDNCCCVNFL